MTWPTYSDEEIAAVQKVLSSGKVNYWTGLECSKFEKEFAHVVGSRFAVALSNGTLALELALNAIQIKQGDEVIVTSRTFFASVSSIVLSGAKPVFVDVDRDTQNINYRLIESAISRKTKAIICVHLAGWPCDMDEIMDIAKEYSLFVIEDCAQAHGAKYKGMSVGSIGDVGCWSFCQDKIISTGGEGGMVTTNSEDLWHRMWSYKDHGKSIDALEKTRNSKGFRWLHDNFGSNFRMTEMQAAIGRIQLQSLEKWNAARNSNLNRIRSAVENNKKVRLPKLKCASCDCNDFLEKSCKNAAYKAYLFTDKTEVSRDKIKEQIEQKDVPCFVGSCSEVYLEEAFDKTEYRPSQRLPVAKELGETSLMFLCDHTLTEEEIDKTIAALIELFQ